MSTLAAGRLRPPPLDAERPSTQLARFLAALDGHRMGPRLQRELGGAATCHVLDAKYEPGVRAILLYQQGQRLVRGDLLPDPAVGAPAAAVPPGVLLSPFPLDPELTSLEAVMDPARLGPALADAVPGLPRGDRRAAARPRLHLLRYRPGKRAVVLVGFAGEPARYVAKAYHDAVKAAAVVAEARALAGAVPGSGRALRLATTVAHLPDLGVVVQAALRGTPLDQLLRSSTSPVARAAVAAAGRALAELHRTDRVTTRVRSVDRELERFVERAARIASVDPPTGRVLGRVGERLLATRAEVPAGWAGTVHGDAKPSQFLCAGAHVHLMDLDHVGTSDQAVDLGTFVASLRQRALRIANGTDAAEGPEADGLAGRFLDAYFDGRPDPERLVRIRWQEAVALERKALRAFARAPRSPLVVALARAADRCLDRVLEEGR